MRNLKENLSLLAKENLDSSLNLKLQIEYKKSKNEEIAIEFEKFLTFTEKLIKRIKRLYVRLKNCNPNENIVFLGLLKLIKNILIKFQTHAKTKLLDFLDNLIDSLNDFLILIEHISFENKKIDNTNNNASDNNLFDDSNEFKHSTPIKREKKKNCFKYEKNQFPTYYKSAFVALMFASFVYFLFKFTNSKSEENEQLDFKNLVGTDLMKKKL